MTCDRPKKNSVSTESHLPNENSATNDPHRELDGSLFVLTLEKKNISIEDHYFTLFTLLVIDIFDLRGRGSS